MCLLVLCAHITGAPMIRSVRSYNGPRSAARIHWEDNGHRYYIEGYLLYIDGQPTWGPRR